MERARIVEILPPVTVRAPGRGRRNFPLELNRAANAFEVAITSPIVIRRWSDAQKHAAEFLIERRRLMCELAEIRHLVNQLTEREFDDLMRPLLEGRDRYPLMLDSSTFCTRKGWLACISGDPFDASDVTHCDPAFKPAYYGERDDLRTVRTINLVYLWEFDYAYDSFCDRLRQIVERGKREFSSLRSSSRSSHAYERLLRFRAVVNTAALKNGPRVRALLAAFEERTNYRPIIVGHVSDYDVEAMCLYERAFDRLYEAIMRDSKTTDS